MESGLKGLQLALVRARFWCVCVCVCVCVLIHGAAFTKTNDYFVYFIMSCSLKPTHISSRSIASSLRHITTHDEIRRYERLAAAGATTFWEDKLLV